jgi:hypothetical protein
VLLAGNAYWILHARQCRYYPLSSLFLVLTLLAYACWQRGGRWGAAAFVAATWCWFQVDYGTVWPALFVLFVDAAIADRRRLGRSALVGLILAATIAPFAWYYELWGRHSVPLGDWSRRSIGNLVNLDRYVAPAIVVATAAALLVVRWRHLSPPERRLMAVAGAILAALALWVPSTAPAAFLRYVIVAAPLGSLLAAWVLARAAG